MQIDLLYIYSFVTENVWYCANCQHEYRQIQGVKKERLNDKPETYLALGIFDVLFFQGVPYILQDMRDIMHCIHPFLLKLEHVEILQFCC